MPPQHLHLALWVICPPVTWPPSGFTFTLLYLSLLAWKLYSLKQSYWYFWWEKATKRAKLPDHFRKIWSCTTTSQWINVSFSTLTQNCVASLSHLKLTLSKRELPLGPKVRHACDTARPAFPYQYRPNIDDIVRLKTILFMLYSEL